MTSSKHTKRALFANVLTLVLCAAIFVGSTFAWFTDSVTSAGNKIIAGNLQVDLIHVGGGDDGQDVSLKDNPGHKIFDYDKWEPNYTVMETLKVVNKGNLAFKFRLDALLTGATAGPGGEALADVIDVYVYTGEGIPTTASFADMTEANGWRNAGSLSALIADTDGVAYGVLLPENAEPKNNEPAGSVQMTVALHMRESAGNAYQELSLGSLDFTLSAAQYTYEEDAFGDQYDKDATYSAPSSSESVSTAAELQAALAKGGLVTLENDIRDLTQPVTIPEGVTVTLDLNGKALASAAGTVIESSGNLTIISTETAGTAENPTLGTIASNSAEDYALRVQKGSVVIGADAETVVIMGQFGAISVCNGANVTINGGAYYAGVDESRPAEHTVYVSDSTLTVNGGTFASGVCDTIYGDGQASVVTLNDGIYVSQSGEARFLKNVVINGGSYNYDPTTLPADSGVTVNGTVVKDESTGFFNVTANG